MSENNQQGQNRKESSSPGSESLDGFIATQKIKEGDNNISSRELNLMYWDTIDELPIEFGSEYEWFSGNVSRIKGIDTPERVEPLEPDDHFVSTALQRAAKARQMSMPSTDLYPGV